MLKELIGIPKGWDSNSIDAPECWIYSLSRKVLSELDSTITPGAGKVTPIEDLALSESCARYCHRDNAPIAEALDSGRGFAIVDRIPVDRYTLDEAKAAYWLIGQSIGIPMKQNMRGTLLYDVRDTGADVRKGVRFSVTNAESTFHNDNAFGATVPDVVGLLCVRTARSGGRSQLVSAYAIHNELLKNHPEVLGTLYENFYFDCRGEHAPDEPPVSQTQVFHWDGRDLTNRYLYYYIQVGHEKMKRPLDSKQENALEVLEELLRRPEFSVEFTLRPGQILFVNNRRILHNRTAYQDFSDPERRRHYVRLWLNWRQ